ncbi:hypothetical protein [Oceanirhabdus seepicola]|uniref:Uncharacterized protein n=1 Tax=Oceanirhabdus seepicola TaxID=2828781 RepID=A0A9J6NYY7_9CLOT|nr:hypothetical protein [Oceanirhabdus seepicola]MCM1989743.1 hypothetical protein [Oceanirhabdus seepicola]
MKGLKSRTKFIVYILVLILIFVGYQFQQQVEIMRQPPSEKWGKEVNISNGKVTRNMKLIKYGYNYIALHNDDFNYKIIEFDYLGNVIKANEIQSDDLNGIYDLSLNLKDDFIYINALTKGKDVIYLETLKLNNNLQLISCETEVLPNNKCFEHIDENIFITSDQHHIEIHDYKTGETKKVQVPLALDEVMGIKINDEYLIVYHAEDEYFYYFTYNNGKISEAKPFLKVKKGVSTSYNQPVIASDGNNFYFITDIIKKGGYFNTLFSQVNIQSGNASKYVFSNLIMKNLKGFYSQDGGRFIYTSPSKQVVDMIIKDGKIIEEKNISRLSSLNINSYLIDDIAIFANFESKDFYNVYVSSIGEEYKIKNNILRKVDIKMAAEKEIKSLFNVITYFFLLGTAWVLPLFAAACIYSLISFRLVKKNKIKSYLVFSLIGILFTTFEIFNYYYSRRLIHYGILQNPIIGISVSVIISASIYGYYLYKYNKDTEGLFMERFLPPLLVDTLLILVLFVPFGL